MAKKTYNDINELLKDLKADVIDTLSGNTDKKVKEIYKKKVEESYDMYSPKTNYSRYRHGIEGSLADEVNFKEYISNDGNSISYILENHRETDCNCEYCRSKNLRIDYYVEEGIAGKSKITPKLIYEKAQDEIDSVIGDFIVKDLNKKGW